jgi:hypothetical protein
MRRRSGEGGRKSFLMEECECQIRKQKRFLLLLMMSI